MHFEYKRLPPSRFTAPQVTSVSRQNTMNPLPFPFFTDYDIPSSSLKLA